MENFYHRYAKHIRFINHGNKQHKFRINIILYHLNIGDWNDISIAHVIIFIKSEVSTFPIVFIFFRGCVAEMFVTSYSVTYCIYIPGKPGICFH